MRWFRRKPTPKVQPKLTLEEAWQRDLLLVEEIKADPTLTDEEKLEAERAVILGPVYGGSMFGHLPYDPFTLQSRIIGPGASQGSFVKGRWTGGPVG